MKPPTSPLRSLEHICWDHFHPSYFAPHTHGADETAEENGHMLMASAIALQSAPASVFEHMDAVQEHLQQQQKQQQQQSNAGSFFSRAAHRHRVSQQPSSSHGLPPPCAPPYLPHHQQRPPSSQQPQQQQQQPQQQPLPSPASWTIPTVAVPANSSTPGAPGTAVAGAGTGAGSRIGAGAASGASLTLENLRCLAAALHPPDVELTPVQAWFEIARERGPAVALDGALMDALRRELALHVRCMHYGAIMPREAFDDVVGRVVGGLR